MLKCSVNQISYSSHPLLLYSRSWSVHGGEGGGGLWDFWILLVARKTGSSGSHVLQLVPDFG